MKKENIIKTQNLIIYFFSCAIFGWFLEVTYAYIVFGKFVNRGFLFGPICPIYGCGTVIMVLITQLIRKKKINTVSTFFIITILFTLLEYVASFVLELIFNLRWWDYTAEFLNLQGRVCLMFSLFFGIAGIIFIKGIYQPCEKLIKSIRMKLSIKKIWIILIFLLILFNVDIVLSCIKYIIK